MKNSNLIAASALPSARQALEGIWPVVLAVAATAAGTALMLWRAELAMVALGVIVLSALSIRYAPAIMVAACAFIAFPQSLTGEFSKMAFSVTDLLTCLLALPVLAAWVRRRRLNLGPAAWPVAFFLLACTASSIVGEGLAWGAYGVMISIGRTFLATALVVVIYGNLAGRGGPIRLFHYCFIGYLAGMPIIAGAMAWAFKENGVQGSMYALGMNKNSLGPVLGCGVVVSFSYLLGVAKASRTPLRTTLLIGILLCSGLGMLLSLSRGAWIATAAACLFVLLGTRNFKAFSTSLVLLIPLLAGIWTMLPEQAVDYATNVSADASSIHERLERIGVVMDAFHSSPIFGVGLGLRKTGEPHNVLILTLGETGILGLVTFCLMIGSAFYTFWKARRSCRDADSRQILLTGAAVMLLTILHGMMDVYWRRGVGVFGWACVGMAVALMNRPQAALDPEPALAGTAAGTASPRRTFGRKANSPWGDIGTGEADEERQNLDRRFRQ